MIARDPKHDLYAGPRPERKADAGEVLAAMSFIAAAAVLLAVLGFCAVELGWLSPRFAFSLLLVGVAGAFLAWTWRTR